ncbi:hypothetical protein FACS1894147_09730 [Spirochaetia bacterium]|nr:hypothetical protein FACS1894147_09730 [Spirochaetia bacterium]
MVLNTLGAEDYGIYNVVAGLVAMLVVFCSSMTYASQRYFSFSIGQGNLKQLQKTFSAFFLIYVLISIVALLLTETLGLWFVNHKLTFPENRIGAVRIVYHASVVSVLCSIMQSLYLSIITAHEDMYIFTLVSLIETVLKLGVVFLLQSVTADKLVLYGILIGVTTFITMTAYITICKIKYQVTKLDICWDKKLFVELIGFNNWNMLGALTTGLKVQALNIILNRFFDAAVIAARSIAISINNVILSFANNFFQAFSPGIIKKYAADEKTEIINVMLFYCKITYFLMFIFVLPLVIETQFVFLLWLKHPPGYVVVFTRLYLMEALIEAFCFPIQTTVTATGRIKAYQILVSAIQLLNLPISWIVLLLGYPPYSVFIIGIGLMIVTCIAKFLIVKKLINYSIKTLVFYIVLPMMGMTILSGIIPLFIYLSLEQGYLRLFLVVVTSVISTGGSMYFLGLGKTEREIIKTMVLGVFLKKNL